MIKIESSDYLKHLILAKKQINFGESLISLEEDSDFVSLNLIHGNETDLNKLKENLEKKSFEEFEILRFLIEEYEELDNEIFFKHIDEISFAEILPFLEDLEKKDLLFDFNKVDENLQTWIAEDAGDKIVFINVKQKMKEKMVHNNLYSLLEKSSHKNVTLWIETIALGEIMVNNVSNNEVSHIVDYLNSPECDKNQIGKTPYKIMKERASSWIDEYNKKVKNTIGIVGIDYLVIETENEYELVHLISENSRKIEGKRMNNCIGRNYLKDNNIYSIRVNQESVASVYINNNVISEIKGYDNKAVDRKHWKGCRAILNKVGVDLSASRDLDNIGYIDIRIIGRVVKIGLESIDYIPKNWSYLDYKRKEEFDFLIEELKSTISEKEIEALKKQSSSFALCPIFNRFISKEEEIFIRVALEKNIIDEKKLESFYTNEQKHKNYNSEFDLMWGADIFNESFDFFLGKMNISCKNDVSIFVTKSEMKKLRQLMEYKKKNFGYNSTKLEMNAYREKIKSFISPSHFELFELNFINFEKENEICQYSEKYRYSYDIKFINFIKKIDNKFSDIINNTFIQCMGMTVENFFKDDKLLVEYYENLERNNNVIPNNLLFVNRFRDEFINFLESVKFFELNSSYSGKEKIDFRQIIFDLIKELQINANMESLYFGDSFSQNIGSILLPSWGKWTHVNFDKRIFPELSFDIGYNYSEIHDSCNNCINQKINGDLLNEFEDIKDTYEDLKNNISEVNDEIGKIEKILEGMYNQIELVRDELIHSMKMSLDVVSYSKVLYYNSESGIRELIKTFSISSRQFFEDFEDFDDSLIELDAFINNMKKLEKDFINYYSDLDYRISKFKDSGLSYDSCDFCDGEQINDECRAYWISHPDNIWSAFFSDVDEIVVSFLELEKFLKEKRISDIIRELSSHLDKISN